MLILVWAIKSDVGGTEKPFIEFSFVPFWPQFDSPSIFIAPYQYIECIFQIELCIIDAMLHVEFLYDYSALIYDIRSFYH